MRAYMGRQQFNERTSTMFSAEDTSRPVGQTKTINGRECVWTGYYWRFANLPPDHPSRDLRATFGDDDEPRGTTPGCPGFRGNC